jgi:hypothetical protein
MELADGDFSNLVLLSDENIKEKWMEGKEHSQAVSMSPDYYLSVRINNGVFPRGILRPELFQITQVKYINYQDDPSWKAVRIL